MVINKNKRLYIYLFCITTLLVSYLLGENSSGGAKLDHKITEKLIENFNNGFSKGINYFLSVNRIHSPIYYFLKAKSILILTENIFNLFYLLLSCSIPLFFYKILKKKFHNPENKNMLFAISLIIFLSPYFRSSAVWATNDNLALLLFTISLYFFCCSFKRLRKKNYYFLISIIFLIGASYIRQSYSLFLIFYIIKSFEILDRKIIFYILLISFILSLPALFYIYNIYELISHNLLVISPMEVNYLNNLLIYLSIISFYFLPFFLSDKNKFKYQNLSSIKIQFILTLGLMLILIFIYSEIKNQNLGGGIILKFSQLIGFNFLFLFSILLGLFLISYYYENFKGLLPLILLFCSYPFPLMYQKYFDPLLILFFVILSESSIIENNILKKQFNIKFLYFYFGIFLIVSNYYYFNRL